VEGKTGLAEVEMIFTRRAVVEGFTEGSNEIGDSAPLSDASLEGKI
jgi:hypothetical protein